MGFSSQPGHIGLRTQAVEGTYSDPGAVAPNQGVFMRFLSGGLGGDRELLIPDPEIGGDRDVPDAQLGPIVFSGDFEYYARMNSLPTLFYGALGTAAAPVDNDPEFTHAITPGNSLPWMSIEEKVGDDGSDAFDLFNYTDAIINSVHLEADAAGYLMGSAGIIAKTQVAEGHANSSETAPGNQRIDNSPQIVGSNITVELNSVALPAKSFSFDLTNNTEDDDFRLGSLFIGDLTPKRREATAGFTIRPEDSDLWRTAVYGNSAANEAEGETTKVPLSITASTYEDIPTGANPYSLLLEADSVAIMPFSLEPSGDDVIEHDIEVQFLRPNPAEPLLTATFVNAYATVA